MGLTELCPKISPPHQPVVPSPRPPPPRSPSGPLIPPALGPPLPWPPRKLPPYLMFLAAPISLLPSPPENTREEEDVQAFLRPPNSEPVLGSPPSASHSPSLTLCISVPSSCHRLRPRETLGFPLSLSPRLAMGMVGGVSRVAGLLSPAPGPFLQSEHHLPAWDA